MLELKQGMQQRSAPVDPVLARYVMQLVNRDGMAEWGQLSSIGPDDIKEGLLPSPTAEHKVALLKLLKDLQEMRPMKMGQLMKKAAAAGVATADITAAGDAEHPNEVLTSLIAGVERTKLEDDLTRLPTSALMNRALAAGAPQDAVFDTRDDDKHSRAALVELVLSVSFPNLAVPRCMSPPASPMGSPARQRPSIIHRLPPAAGADIATTGRLCRYHTCRK